MSEFEIDKEAPVLVELIELAPSPGVRKAAKSSKDLTEMSPKALDSAMNTIHHMARRIVATMEALSDDKKPTQVEAAFGLKLTTEGGAIIAKAGIESTINVKLTWENERRNS